MQACKKWLLSRHSIRRCPCVLESCRKVATQRCPWSHVESAPPDPILGLVTAFKADPSDVKVSLAQGAYRTEEGLPFVLNCIRKAEASVALHENLFKEYNEVEGDEEFCDLSCRFVLGEASDSPAVAERRVCSVQALSGTGALRLAAGTLADVAGFRSIWMGVPSWGNHQKIFAAAGLEVQTYQYLDAKGTGLNFDGMMHALEHQAPSCSVVLFHAAAHNPTGVDPTEEQWRAVANVCARKQHIPLIDSAYQGFATGDAVRDAFAVRLFVEKGLFPVICQSFAKNMGLYGERVGALHIVTTDHTQAATMLSQVKAKVVRPMYSSPPLHGARLATRVLRDPSLRAEWDEELRAIVAKIAGVRVRLANELDAAGAIPPGTNTSWDHIRRQIGMFAFTGLSAGQVQRLRDDRNIYMTLDGRLSLAGLKTADVPYVAHGIAEVCAR